MVSNVVCMKLFKKAMKFCGQPLMAKSLQWGNHPSITLCL